MLYALKLSHLQLRHLLILYQYRLSLIYLTATVSFESELLVLEVVLGRWGRPYFINLCASVCLSFEVSRSLLVEAGWKFAQQDEPLHPNGSASLILPPLDASKQPSSFRS
uniref:Uncharacterized protein n=1 Tax=Grammatophora oceanica TaxID=210454 RepID=A0A7S1YMA6_9STRA|mmetsp:Transcript_951/g.1325  ORF Transcript_951/g.1325 Transcript_951/m.1325 type:complete len:110 (+) Transcript_951:37-366(+)